MPLVLEIQDEVVQALGVPASEVEAELKKELAVAFYARGALSLGKAAEVSGVSRHEFEALLGRRKIERPYDQEELDRDLAWARGD